MSRELRINYLYMEERTQERFETACEQMGWAYKALVQQCIHAFFKRNRDFYAEAAIKDCQARGMEESNYYRTLRDESEESLDRYVSGRPGFGSAPLDAVDPVATGDENRKRYGVITLSNYNSVLLKVCRVVDNGPMIQVISRIVKGHFNDYWDAQYRPQIERDRDCKFK
jgi:hypothetical protein